nr:A24 family peptidase [Microbacterium thalassium]
MLIGSFLNVVAYRVPAGISLLRESRCPHCDAPVKPWQNVPVLSWLFLRGRCASCGEAISMRYPIVEAITGLAFAGTTWWLLSTTESGARWGLAVLVAAYLYFVSISVVLTLIDLDTHRLPNVIVIPSYIVAAALLTVGSALTADWIALIRAGIGMAVLYVFYFLLRLARPDGMGGGDVKLAGVVGLYLGYIGWGALAVGAFAAFVLGGVYGVVLMLTRRAGRKTAIPFGPWMILGAWFGVLTGEQIARWYVGMFVTA